MNGSRRYAVIGVGARAAMYVEALTGAYADVGRIVAWCDANTTRMAFYDEVVAAGGGRPPARYLPEGFDRLLEEQRPDVVVVTSPDHTHARYVVARARGGLRRDRGEAADASTAERLRRRSPPRRAHPGKLTVTFNYRYAPRNSARSAG